MFARWCLWAGVAVVLVTTGSASAQEKVPPSGKDPKLPPAPSAQAVAAKVNGQPIMELSVYRGLLQVDPAKWAGARKDVLNYLVDNMLVDQYLTQLKIPVEAKELEERVGQIKAEAKKSGMEFEMLLKRLFLSETDLRRELTGALRKLDGARSVSSG